jgi:transcriptional regulator with XRE-family HTH domain
MHQRRAPGDPASIEKTIGARIREARLLAGITQRELASRVGVSVQQVQNYEYGAGCISAVQLLLVAEIVGVPMGMFFQGVSSSAPSPDRAGQAFAARTEDAAIAHRQEVELVRSFRRLRDDDMRRWALKLLLALEGAPENIGTIVSWSPWDPNG